MSFEGLLILDTVHRPLRQLYGYIVRNRLPLAGVNDRSEGSRLNNRWEDSKSEVGLTMWKFVP